MANDVFPDDLVAFMANKSNMIITIR